MTILILGGMDDDHARYMLEHLERRGVDVELLDSRWFPTRLGIAHDPTTGSGTLRLPSGRRLAFSEVRAVYWRCYNSIAAPTLPDAEQWSIASNDARGLFESLLIDLPALWVNGWAGFQLHQTKPVQLARVAKLGVAVPATLLSNDAEAVRSFAARHPRCIFKPIQGGAHTRRVTPAHLTDAHLEHLSLAPVTLQEEIVGTNIRVFVVGKKVLSCEVRTEAIDFRDDRNADISAHPLPDEIAEESLRVAAALELRWTGIDYRLTPEGRYVFLEANPSPMFIGFEQASGLPLTESLTELLLQGSR